MKLVFRPPPPPLGVVAVPPPATEFPLVPKPKSTMLVFGPDSTVLPLTVPVVDPNRPPVPQESYKLAGQVGLIADALPARSTGGAFMASLKARLEAEQAKQHKTLFADESVNPANPMGGGLIPIKVGRRVALPQRGCMRARCLPLACQSLCFVDVCSAFTRVLFSSPC